MDRFRVEPGSRVSLSGKAARGPDLVADRKAAEQEMESLAAKLLELQELFYADNRYALLIILQGMDTSGKDGVIRHVMRGINPQGCRVVSFKAPTPEELDHDYLWRIHQHVPRRGEIGIFNRSHYEDVLAVRVRRLVPEAVWRARYDQINAFESFLAANGVILLKLFLHISREEQEQRLIKRLKNPRKHWKFDPADLPVRAAWDEYMNACAEMIERCTTETAPWHFIPSDRKWLRDLIAARLVVSTLQGLPLAWPRGSDETRRLAALVKKTGSLPES